MTSQVLTAIGYSTPLAASTLVTTATRWPFGSPLTKARQYYSSMSPRWSVSGGSSDALRPGIVDVSALDALAAMADGAGCVR
ncbi:hypothetical protein PC129_g19340 [Phytophthora cactorum]|uniref:Uncharacterized protein n=1 Tax=Phytophthora cactorum TaxID=29920 RepID=A0A329RBE8_9STRA|nr:hypothetical protein Pcac1_g20874 [Phytophthora cactorum]KAG2900177.1 hypothetical protein PC115_g16313 [Phytophthora cactorum]KAG2931983.1 hypothetical protein PC114_g1943 [Phytophthora cactorum]KAG2936578.1 hypothetical protein PC117_g11993 [Phytophthora cactorum]KAG2996281.1 hypothetical protein PC119_g17869 [Phytophthora cactorum]